MYQVLKNGKLLINAHDLATATVYVRSLESELIKGVQHSPYTIGLAPTETPDQARARNKQAIQRQLSAC